MTQGDYASARRGFSRHAKKYYRLRATHRVVGPAARAVESLPSEGRLRKVCGRMREFSGFLRSEEVPSDWKERLDAIEFALDAHARRLREGLGSVDLAKLRAVVPGLCQTDRADVTAFLDLCIEDREQMGSLMVLIEYLITTLATEELDGRRVVTTDPTRVTHRVAALATEHAGESYSDIHVIFSEAIAEMQSWDAVDDVLMRMRDYKKSVLDSFWVPAVLRALIEYNVAAGNRMLERVSAERLLDEEECGSSADLEFAFEVDADEDDGEEQDVDTLPPPTPLSELGSRPAPEPAPPPIVAPESPPPPAGDVFACVVHALRARVLGQGIDAGPEGAVGSLLDVSRLSDYERDALVHIGDDETSLASRDVILLGLLLKHRRVVAGPLEQLGLGFDEIEKERVPEARAKLRKLISAEISNGRYQESRPLADVLSRHLPVGTGARPRRKARLGGAAQRHAIDVGEHFRPGELEASLQSSLADAQPRARAKTRPSKARARQKPEPGGISGVQVGILVVSLAFICLSVFSLMVGHEGTVVPIPAPELAEISPYLESGSRDGLGSGPVVIGTFEERWASLDVEAREQHAEEIARSLHAIKVSKAMLFDDRRRLHLHYSNGRIRYLNTRR